MIRKVIEELTLRVALYPSQRVPEDLIEPGERAAVLAPHEQDIESTLRIVETIIQHQAAERATLHLPKPVDPEVFVVEVGDGR